MQRMVIAMGIVLAALLAGECQAQCFQGQNVAQQRVFLVAPSYSQQAQAPCGQVLLPYDNQARIPVGGYGNYGGTGFALQYSANGIHGVAGLPYNQLGLGVRNRFVNGRLVRRGLLSRLFGF